ncbi:hypothetical protein PR202_ga29952 [Eleusine coracana subsp. coracana]|uniref:Uncharacterized protein n=1 Tax=Eleusine coracana subsp. coracana TaxID=191504 RepID=A0AAV5DN90_ELECO|nr:hypothetical protein PR202_ga29952 [Eleusine coracana subsp. coracana]
MPAPAARLAVASSVGPHCRQLLRWAPPRARQGSSFVVAAIAPRQDPAAVGRLDELGSLDPRGGERNGGLASSP